MRPSSWNGVGAMAKVPAAWAVSFMVFLWFRHSGMVLTTGPGMTALYPHDGITEASETPRAHLDLLLGEENLLGVLDHILRVPAAMRRLPAVHLHHSHLADATGARNAQNLAGLVTREIADHVQHGRRDAIRSEC